MPDTPPPDGGDIRPLSRRSSRLLVVLAVVAAFALAIGAALYLADTATDTAERQRMQEFFDADSTQAP